MTSPTPGQDGAAAAAPPAEPDWEEQVARLLRRPENLRSVYQPIVDLRSGACVGYEALTRVAEWPARSPEPWFIAASRTGLSAQLEAAALLTSLRGRAEMPREHFLTVNVTPVTLTHTSVTEVLLDQGDLRGLVAELTELEPVVGEGAHASALAGLRERGLMVATDVVEGGVTELERVTAVRPDLIKVDRRLVKGVHADPVRDRFVRLLVTMANEMGAAVLAEGVEALEDARFLQFVGVRMAQGWLFGRARPGFLPPSGEVTEWLRAAWEENVTLTRVGRLAVPLARVGEPGNPDGWLADVDGLGRLRALVGAGGNVTVPASTVVRLRSSQDLRSAAHRVLVAGPQRRPHGLVVVVDDEGRFVGLVDADVLLREVVTGADAGPPDVVVVD
ncbi:MAG: EAL domain-containing protein [Actinomycetales bacterium]|nr:EAL domain-containing protein [Actinomycetales bacterium]